MAGIAAPLLQQTLARLGVAARRLGLSDHDWALAAGIRPETLSRLRQRQDCDLATLVKIARAAHCTLTLNAQMQGEALVSQDGLFPGKVSLREERAIAALACREASYQRTLDKARLAWLAMGPAFFMAGVALLASRALPQGRARLVELAEVLHPGITVGKVFARWRGQSPLPAGNILRAVLEQARTPMAREPEALRLTTAEKASKPPQPKNIVATTTKSLPAAAAQSRGAGFAKESDAAKFMANYVLKLQRKGWVVRTEVPQSYVNDRGRTVEGRIDVVAEKAQRVIAYELDRAGAREKSILKLRAYSRADEAYVICRNGRALRIGRERAQQQRAKTVVASVSADYRADSAAGSRRTEAKSSQPSATTRR